LYSYAHEKLSALPVSIISLSPSEQQLGILTFSIPDLPHQLVGTILSSEYGIGVRSGCFCAMPYVQSLLGMSPEQINNTLNKVKQDETFNESDGFVRVSFSLYSTKEEIDQFIDAIKHIIDGKYQTYEKQASGEFQMV
jgi:cysteine desulfurase / selenocysteine lyase